jgi:hypothetical protein
LWTTSWPHKTHTPHATYFSRMSPIINASPQRYAPSSTSCTAKSPVLLKHATKEFKKEWRVIATRAVDFVEATYGVNAKSFLRPHHLFLGQPRRMRKAGKRVNCLAVMSCSASHSRFSKRHSNRRCPPLSRPKRSPASVYTSACSMVATQAVHEMSSTKQGTVVLR